MMCSNKNMRVSPGNQSVRSAIADLLPRVMGRSPVSCRPCRGTKNTKSQNRLGYDVFYIQTHPCPQFHFITLALDSVQPANMIK